MENRKNTEVSLTEVSKNSLCLAYDTGFTLTYLLRLLWDFYTYI